MLLRLSVFLLSFIIAANCVLKDKNKAIELIDVQYFTGLGQTDDNVEDGSDDENKATTSYTAPEQNEEEILKDSYNNCRTWLGKSLNSTIKTLDFLSYMGEIKGKDDILRDYFQNNEEASKIQADIDLKLYVELFKHICSIRDLTVKDCVARIKRKASSRIVSDFMFRTRGLSFAGYR